LFNSHLELLFHEHQEFNGNLKDNDGSVTTTGTIATLTAGASKGLYLATAKISWRRASGSGTEQLIVNLLQNTVTIESFQVNASLSVFGNYDFLNPDTQRRIMMILRIKNFQD
jgi:hypothetical protein